MSRPHISSLCALYRSAKKAAEPAPAAAAATPADAAKAGPATAAAAAASEVVTLRVRKVNTQQRARRPVMPTFC